MRIVAAAAGNGLTPSSSLRHAADRRGGVNLHQVGGKRQAGTDRVSPKRFDAGNGALLNVFIETTVGIAFTGAKNRAQSSVAGCAYLSRTRSDSPAALRTRSSGRCQSKLT
jgi:hypothetical protein